MTSKGNLDLNDWPDELPASCPPEDAAPSHDKVFRLVSTDDPTPDDFVSAYRLRPGRFVSVSDEQLCQSMGLSVFGSPDDADKTRRAIGPLRSKKIAGGSLAGSGLALDTPSMKSPTHKTWWRPESDEQWQNFSVIE
jgi:hypothetical protein